MITRFCCEKNLPHGGPTVKKFRTHTHLKKLAPAIYYRLCQGVMIKVYYNPETRTVFHDEIAAKASGKKYEMEEVEFIPEHRYLKLRLPRSSDLSL